MIVNLYIEINRDNVHSKSEFECFEDLKDYLWEKGMKFYDATDFDSCTSGPCALDNLFDIEAAVEGK